jgi:hypothetical protein
MASTDARPVPQKNVAFRVTFPLLDADGDLVTGASSLDSEISKDGGTFADCTNEATEIATSSGVYYLDLTSTEMNADTVAVIVKSASAKTTTLVMYPEEAGDIRVNVTAFGGTAGTFSSGRPEVNASHISGSQTAADNVEVVYSTDFATNYDTTLDRWQVDVDTWLGTTAQGASGRPQVDVELWLGSAPNALVSGRVDASAGAVASGAITAAAIATDAIDADALAADAIAEINATVDTALADYDGPTNAEMVARTLAAADYATATALGTVDSNVDDILVDTGTDIPATLAALNNISTSDVEAIVWDVPMASHLGAGTTGDAIFQAAIAAMAVQAVTDNLPDSGALTSLAQASALATVDQNVDDILTDTGTTIPGTITTLQTSVDDLPTNAELATALGTADDAVLAAIATVDSNVDDIKTKTDSLTFTVAGQVDANIQYVNDIEVNGTGNEANPWGP